MNGYLYRRRADGTFLNYREHTTHTGFHRQILWVEDINEATVFYMPPPSRGFNRDELAGCDVLMAREIRRVELITAKEISQSAGGAAVVPTQGG